MLVFPNCKINIGLNILDKRDDGFHNLETIFYPVGLHDVLEIIRSQDGNTELPVSFSQSGMIVDGEISNNICVKAYHLLKQDYPQIPGIHLHLHKAIPMGAGLGGGSADGAFMLRLLNTKFNLNISDGQLLEYALELGSDCPFFIINKPCHGSGRGEKLKAIELDLSGFQLLLINPGIQINTGWAFSKLSLSETKKSDLLSVVREPVETWKGRLCNDFEEIVFAEHPVLKDIKEELYAGGALFAAMSGSGSSLYGIFEKDQSISTGKFDAFFTRKITL